LAAWWAAVLYSGSLALILVHESREGSPLAVAFFAPSVLAGLVIGRLWAVALPLGVIVVSRPWVGVADADGAVVAMLAGLLCGVLLTRVPEIGRSRSRQSHEHQRRADAPAHRLRRLKSVLRPFVNRSAFEDVLDGLRFRIDTFPNGLYQPVSSLPKRAARGVGSESRWSAMLPVIDSQSVRNAVDIGACEGYFAIELAAAGVPTIAVESSPANVRTALLAVRRSGTSEVGVLALTVSPSNVGSLPAADAVLCLSIWHHFVRKHGVDQATAMLETIWQQTRKVMFFDTGETEMTPDYGLPSLEPDPASWLADYLAATCPGSRVDHLGRHRAFDPSGNPCERNLFAVIRG
jgi:2-polyprenyl-3-methyl-5-hydroxy-6-metoxy-1,4-benzoquinol methylase